METNSALRPLHRSFNREKGGEEEYCAGLTLGEILELFELARVEYLRLFLNLVVLDKPLFELLPSRKRRNYRG